MGPVRPTSVLFDVFVVAQRTRALLDLALAGAPLTPGQYAMYSAALEFGPLSTSELARRLGLPVTSAHDEVAAMLRLGHLERRRNPRDGRAFLLRLTPSGRDLHRQTSEAFEGAIRAVEARLGLPVAEVRSALAALAAACEGATSDVLFEGQDAEAQDVAG